MRLDKYKHARRLRWFFVVSVLLLAFAYVGGYIFRDQILAYSGSRQEFAFASGETFFVNLAKGKERAQYYLTITTERRFGCSNYEMVYEKTIEGNEIYIDLVGVALDGGCATMMGIARSSVPLTLGGSVYVLRFSLPSGRSVDSYILDARTDPWSMSPIKASFTEIGSYPYRRPTFDK